MTSSRLLLAASLTTIFAIGLWGVLDAQGLVTLASAVVERYFQSRGWFVML